jgi:hypothetical protein
MMSEEGVLSLPKTSGLFLLVRPTVSFVLGQKNVLQNQRKIHFRVEEGSY